MGHFTDSWTDWLAWLDDFWMLGEVFGEGVEGVSIAVGEVLGEVVDGVSIAAPRLEFTWVVMDSGTGEVVILGNVVRVGVAVDFWEFLVLVDDGDLCLRRGYDLVLKRGDSVPVLVEQLVVLEVLEFADSSFKANFICCLKNVEPNFWLLQRVSLIALIAF